MKQALFWENTKDQSSIKCTLCPNFCLIQQNQTGICRKRKNIQSQLYTTNYGETITIAIDPMRKKPLYHFHPNENILSIGANSCNLSCKFCQNYTSSQMQCKTIRITPTELINSCTKNNVKHIAFTYTEPFTWFEYIYDTAILLKENNISVVLITNGYVNPQPLNQILPYIDAMNIDLKAFSNEFYQTQCNATLEPVLNTIRTAATKTHIEITLLLIETLNDDTELLDQMFTFIRDINPEIPLHISKYFPRYKAQIPPTKNEAVYKAVEQAQKYLKYEYAGNIHN